MTDKASPNEPRASPDEPGIGPDLARFFQDWSDLWCAELQAQAQDPDAVPWGMLAKMGGGGVTSDMTAAMEMWRAAMVAWANFSGAGKRPAENSGATTPGADELARPVAGVREPAATPRTQAVAAASDARDAEVERLARRVDELEARLAALEKPRRRRG